MKPGYIYVLTHPSDPDLYKVGITILDPKIRLNQHNRDLDRLAGSFVRETGQKWKLKEFHPVPDPYNAEKAFWNAMPFVDFPLMGNGEVVRLSWEHIEIGLEAARKAGVRYQPPPLSADLVANDRLVREQLAKRNIRLLGKLKTDNSYNTFVCGNGHRWRMQHTLVLDGKGCLICGFGEVKGPDAGVICLLVHPDKAGLVSIGVGYGTLDEICEDYPWGDWDLHLHQNVDQVEVAEVILWELLGIPLPHSREPIQIDIKIAENALNRLIYEIRLRQRIEKAG